MQRPAVKRTPISPDEFALIDRAARKFRFKLRHQHANWDDDIIILDKIDYDTRAFANDLKDLILKPESFDTIEIGKILAELSDADRLMLVKFRPDIVHDCYDLIILLRYYIPLKSRTLFACALVELMYRDDSEYMLRNIQVVQKLLPEKDQENYLAFCMKIMRGLDTPAIEREAKRSAKYFTSALVLSVLGQCASNTLAPLTRKVSAVGAVYLILKGMYRLNDKLTFWDKVNYNEMDSPPQTPTDSLARGIKD